MPCQCRGLLPRLISSLLSSLLISCCLTFFWSFKPHLGGGLGGGAGTHCGGGGGCKCRWDSKLNPRCCSAVGAKLISLALEGGKSAPRWQVQTFFRTRRLLKIAPSKSKFTILVFFWREGGFKLKSCYLRTLHQKERG